MFKFKQLSDLDEWKTTLAIALVCLVLIIFAQSFGASNAWAIPDGWRVFSTILFVAFFPAAILMILNDIDAWPRVLLALITIAIVAIQLGYKMDAKADPINKPKAVPEMERKP